MPPRRMPVGTRQRIVSIFGGSVGNLVEWYDWYIYAAFSLYFAKAFFPAGDTTAQLLNTAGVFALGFLMRPVGGWVIGVYADRYGRKAALTLSVTPDVPGLADDRPDADLRAIGVAAPILLGGPAAPGPQRGRRIRRQRHLSDGDRDAAHRGFYSSFQYVTLIGASCWPW
jgi:MHS family alpha-ketoglutarate permease-like MFS transporter